MATRRKEAGHLRTVRSMRIAICFIEVARTRCVRRLPAMVRTLRMPLPEENDSPLGAGDLLF
jgi:hypothetical protein